MYTLNIDYLENNKKKTKFIPIRYKIQKDCRVCVSHKANQGYTRIRYNGKQYHMHRFIYEMYKKPIPKNKVVRHKCHNKLCINPKHLIIGTPYDNVQDNVKDNRQAMGEKIANSKLTEKDVRYIRQSDKNGTQLSKELNICHTTIYKIKNYQTWRHIK